jgi:hypothetical protein
MEDTVKKINDRIMGRPSISLVRFGLPHTFVPVVIPVSAENVTSSRYLQNSSTVLKLNMHRHIVASTDTAYSKRQ